jgi:hypothetical protein
MNEWFHEHYVTADYIVWIADMLQIAEDQGIEVKWVRMRYDEKHAEFIVRRIVEE